jgi:hypothetical protein
MTTITYTISNQINFPVSGIDDPDEVAPDRLPSVYGNFRYGFDLSFTVVPPDDTATITSVELVSVPNFVAGSILDGTIARILRNLDGNPFTDETFNFIRLSGDVGPFITQILVPGTETDDDRLFDWKPPDNMLLEDVVYSFRINYEESLAPGVTQSEVVILLQDIHWNVNASIQIFEDLL